MPYDIEISSLGQDNYVAIEEAADLLNGCQKEFRFSVPPDRLRDHGLLFDFEEYSARSVFTFLEEYRERERGNRQFLIAVVPGFLSSEKLRNLFGSRRSLTSPDRHLAVITTHEHQKYVSSRSDFLCYYFIRYSLSFVADDIIAHEENRSCFFDKRLDKRELIKSVEVGKICDECRAKLQRHLNPEIDSAVRKMVSALREKSMPRDQVFISYSHKDKAFFEEFQTMLAPLVRNGALTAWDDTQIKAGADWRKEIDDALTKAKVGVLLVSPDFLDSDFIMEKELAALHEAAERGELTLIWVAVRPCLHKDTILEKYQAANDPNKPILSLSKPEREKELRDICQQIKVTIEVSATYPASGSPPPPPSPPTQPSETTRASSDRLNLLQRLSSIPSGQFNAIVFALRMPPGIVPGAPAAQADRAFALLESAEGHGGCGLDQVQQILDQVVNP